MLIIGICGASGSGKSTLARELASRLEGRCVYLKQDSYYKDHPDMSFEERERINYDEPEAFEHVDLYADLRELPARLTAVMPEGIRVTDCYEQVNRTALLKFLEIRGAFEYDDRPLADMAEKLNRFYSQEAIVIEKKTKRGQGQSDIRPAIKEISFAPGEGLVRLHAVISAQEPTLNPALLADALRQLAPELSPDYARFTRIENYLENMEIFG